jgi:plastocyanin
MRYRLLFWCALTAAAGCGEYFSPRETERLSADGSPIFFACLPERFEDRSAAGAERVVAFGVAPTPFVYAPKCMRIAAGQSVTFRGAFGTHPLTPGAGPMARMAGSPGNPVPETSAGMSIDVRFMAPGVYPYFCSQHVAAGMAGVIEVRP